MVEMMGRQRKDRRINPLAVTIGFDSSNNVANLMVDLNELALFVEVVRWGSFAEAARRRGMPSNTLSRRVAQLEQALGARLLQRSTRKLTLTDAGRKLHQRCAASIEALQDATHTTQDEGGQPVGRVRMAVMADFFDWWPMDWVGAFLAAHPGVQIEFVLSDGRSDLIAEGVDLALRAGELPDSSLVARAVVSEARFALYASPAYLAAHGTPTTPQALSTQDCITPVTPSGQSRWLLEGPAGRVEVTVQGRFGANTLQARHKAAVAGLGVALLPEQLAAFYVQESRLQPVLPGWYQPAGGVYLVFPSRRQPAAAVRAWADFLMTKQDEVPMPQPQAGSRLTP